METGSGQTPEPPTPPERPTPPRRRPLRRPTPPPEKPGSGPKLSERLRQPRVAAGIGIALAVVIILVLLLSGGDDEGGSSDSDSAAGEAREVSAQELEDLASSLDHPVYWIGEQDGKRLELTETQEGNVFVRYLDPDVEVGSREVAALTIGTYPVTDAFAAVQKTAKQQGAITARRRTAASSSQPGVRQLGLHRLSRHGLPDRGLRPRPPRSRSRRRPPETSSRSSQP